MATTTSDRKERYFLPQTPRPIFQNVWPGLRANILADTSADILADTPADTPADIRADTPADIPADISADTPAGAPADILANTPADNNTPPSPSPEKPHPV